MMISMPNRLRPDAPRVAPARIASKRSARVSRRPRRCCSSAEQAQAVLDDDHGAVDDEAEVEAPRLIRLALTRFSTMPVTVNSIDSGMTQRRDQRRAEVAEQQEQHDDDQQRAFEQVLLDRRDGGVDQRGAVVDRARRRRPSGSDAVDLRRAWRRRAARRCGCSRRSACMAVPSTDFLAVRAWPRRCAARLPSPTSATSPIADRHAVARCRRRCRRSRRCRATWPGARTRYCSPLRSM